MKQASFISFLFATPLLMASFGCGNGLSTLTGVVRIDGKPAPEGVSLEFTPTAPGGSSSYGSTDAQGQYEAEFTFREKGIQPGEHRVRLVPGGAGPGGVSRMPVIGPDGQPVGTDQVEPAAFPDAYYQEITKIQVQPGANEIDIDLVTGSGE